MDIVTINTTLSLHNVLRVGVFVITTLCSSVALCSSNLDCSHSLSVLLPSNIVAKATNQKMVSPLLNINAPLAGIKTSKILMLSGSS